MKHLTVEQKQEIRALYASGAVTQCELATHFGVRQSTISHVLLHPQHVCAGCNTPIACKTYCDACRPAHRREREAQYKETHREQVREYARTYQKTSARWPELHRRAARNYERRKAQQRREMSA